MSKIIGNYIIDSKLSEGSFGKIYFGKHNILQTKIIIKQRIKQQDNDSYYSQLFKDEALMLELLQHPSLPVFRDYIEDIKYGQLIFSKFVEGETLESKVKLKEFIDDEHCCWIISRLLDALSYCHYLGIIHCDPSPRNVIIDTKNHNATLIDFGLAYYQPHNKSRAKGGTPEYLPPEFLEELPPLPQSDLYSLAKLFLFMSGGNVKSNKYSDSTPEELSGFFDEMLRENPLDRPDNANDLLTQLTSIRKRLFGRTSTPEEIKFK